MTNNKKAICVPLSTPSFIKEKLCEDDDEAVHSNRSEILRINCISEEKVSHE
jgi:hypothetical protein